MTTPKSKTLRTDDDNDYEAMIAQIAVEEAEVQQVEEEEWLRKEKEKAVREERIAELKWRKAEQELVRKKAEEERLAREENERKEKEQQEQEEREKREEWKWEVQEVEKRRKWARGGEDEDMVMEDAEDRGRMKWTKSGESEKSKAGPSRPKGKGRAMVPSRSRTDGSSRTNNVYVEIIPLQLLYSGYYDTYNQSSGSKYRPSGSKRMDEDEEESSSEEEEEEEKKPKQMRKKHTWGTKGPDGRKMRMGGDNPCGICVQLGVKCEVHPSSSRTCCVRCEKVKKKCEPVTTDDVPSMPVVRRKTKYQVEKLALMWRGVETMDDMREEMYEMQEEMRRMWNLLERMAPERKADEGGSETDDDEDNEGEGKENAEEKGE